MMVGAIKNLKLMGGRKGVGRVVLQGAVVCIFGKLLMTSALWPGSCMVECRLQVRRGQWPLLRAMNGLQHLCQWENDSAPCRRRRNQDLVGILVNIHVLLPGIYICCYLSNSLPFPFNFNCSTWTNRSHFVLVEVIASSSSMPRATASRLRRVPLYLCD